MEPVYNNDNQNQNKDGNESKAQNEKRSADFLDLSRNQNNQNFLDPPVNLPVEIEISVPPAPLFDKKQLAQNSERDSKIAAGEIEKESRSEQRDSSSVKEGTEFTAGPAVLAVSGEAVNHREPVVGFPAKPAKISYDKKSHTEFIFHIEVDKIKPNPHQPRRDFNEDSLKELAASIREFGILQPLVVSKIEKETDFGTDVEYQLIAGERRLRAAKILGLERVPAVIRGVAKDAENLEMAIVENLQRSDLNPIETARAYAKLQDVFGLTQREIAARLGKSRETVANSLRLLNLPKDIQDAVAEGKINESQGRLLLTIKEPSTQKTLFNDLINRSLSVRELKSFIKKTDSRHSAGGGENKSVVDPEIRDFQEKLAEFLGTRVKIEKKEDRGKIVIDFYSPEELENIVSKFRSDDNLPL